MGKGDLKNDRPFRFLSSALKHLCSGRGKSGFLTFFLIFCYYANINL